MNPCDAGNDAYGEAVQVLWLGTIAGEFDAQRFSTEIDVVWGSSCTKRASHVAGCGRCTRPRMEAAIRFTQKKARVKQAQRHKRSGPVRMQSISGGVIHSSSNHYFHLAR
jgi:hypothetical protein